jgi:hypothetical protein
MRPNDDLAHEGVAMAITIEQPRKRGGKSFYRLRLWCFTAWQKTETEVTDAKIIVTLCLPNPLIVLR